MNRLLLTLTLCAAALAPAAVTARAAPPPASASASAGHVCFNQRDIRGFKPSGDSAVNLRVGGHEVYRLELMGPCNNLDWAHWVRLRPHGIAGSFICNGQGVDLITKDDVCLVSSIRKLTPEEAAALPRKEQP